MNFLSKYDLLKKNFLDVKLFTRIIGCNNKIVWPESSGVYVIWRKNSDNMDNLIYIGMTGKYSRNKEDNNVGFNDALFKSRQGRSTPYRFCQSKKDKGNKYEFNFRYGPKISNVDKQSKIKYDLDAYKASIPYTELLIHCFHINDDHEEYTPILLESILLTKYIKSKGSLPPANNSL